MRCWNRRWFGYVALCGAVAAGAPRLCVPAIAQTETQLDKQHERLIIAVMVMRNGEIVADEAATYGAYQQYKEQLLTLDIPIGSKAHTILVTIRDSDAGGVLVRFGLMDNDGHAEKPSEFVMYPFVEKAANRVEPLRLPILSAGHDMFADPMAPGSLELHLAMKRIVRSR